MTLAYPWPNGANHAVQWECLDPRTTNSSSAMTVRTSHRPPEPPLTLLSRIWSVCRQTWRSWAHPSYHRMGRHCRAGCTPPALRFDIRHAFHRSEAYRDWPSCSNNSRKRRSMPMGWQRCGFKRHGHARKRKRPRHVTRSTGPCCYERGRYTSHPCR